MGYGLANGKNSFLRKKWLNGFDLILAYLFPGTIRRLTYLAVYVRTVFSFKIGIAVSSKACQCIFSIVCNISHLAPSDPAKNMNPASKHKVITCYSRAFELAGTVDLNVRLPPPATKSAMNNVHTPFVFLPF